MQCVAGRGSGPRARRLPTPALNDEFDANCDQIEVFLVIRLNDDHYSNGIDAHRSLSIGLSICNQLKTVLLLVNSGCQPFVAYNFTGTHYLRVFNNDTSMERFSIVNCIGRFGIITRINICNQL